MSKAKEGNAKKISAKNSSIKTIVVMILFAIVAIGIYYRLNDSTSSILPKADVEETEEDILIAKDIEGNYPATPREVLKLYGRIMECLQNDQPKESKVEQLVNQMRLLLDEEFLSHNELEIQLQELLNEMKEFQKSKSSITSYNVSESESVTYWINEEREMSSIEVNYTIKQNSSYIQVTEKYVLRKDSEEHWKILGWQILDQTIKEN